MGQPAFSCFSVSRLFRACAIATLLCNSLACSAAPDRPASTLSNDEDTFVFAGQCANGTPYRLVSYQKHAAGLTRSYYDYDGPVGTGTVQTESTPRVMAVRVCRQLAEIVNTYYWE